MWFEKRPLLEGVFHKEFAEKKQQNSSAAGFDDFLEFRLFCLDSTFGQFFSWLQLKSQLISF